MTLFDWITLAVIFFSAFVGFWRGFTREAFGITSWCGASVGAFVGLPFIQPLVAQLVPSPLWSLILGGGALFLVFLIVLLFLSDGIVTWVRGSFFSGIDRILGLCFGSARGLLLVCLFYWGLVFLAPASQSTAFVEGAVTLPFVGQTTDTLKEWIESHVDVPHWVATFQSHLSPVFEKTLGNEKDRQLAQIVDAVAPQTLAAPAEPVSSTSPEAPSQPPA